MRSLRAGGIELKVVDVGVGARQVPAIFASLLSATEAEMNAALKSVSRWSRTRRSIPLGDLLGFGEMGIGNTTSASAMTAAGCCGLPAASVIGSGAGGADDAWRRGSVWRSNVRSYCMQSGWYSAFGILQYVGGLKSRRCAASVLAVASRRVPVVTGRIRLRPSAARATRMCPAASGYLFASHRSTELAHLPADYRTAARSACDWGRNWRGAGDAGDSRGHRGVFTEMNIRKRGSLEQEIVAGRDWHS